MSQTEVLLIKPVEGLGAEGDQVKVRSGYARNFLLPRSIAVPLNQANKKRLEALRAAREKREAAEQDDARSMAARLEKTSLAIAVKTGEGGKMFGSVTSAHLSDRLAEDGIQLDRRKIHLAAPVKTLGRHVASVKLHRDITIELPFEVVSENPIEQPVEQA